VGPGPQINPSRKGPPAKCANRAKPAPIAPVDPECFVRISEQIIRNHARIPANKRADHDVDFMTDAEARGF
jgi:hypothetical protein